MARELGLISCAEMVQAFLDDRKSETRRIEGLKVLSEHPSWWKFLGWTNPKHGVEARFYNSRQRKTEAIKPRYQVGDHLYAKETWKPTQSQLEPRVSYVRYKADDSREIVEHDLEGIANDKWRSPLFMPKKFARIWRKVTGVKDPHRLQDISQKDVKAEGVRPCYKMDSFSGWHYIEVCGEEREDDVRWLGPWIVLWDRLHDKPGERWADNPWVLPYALEPVEKGD